jgi:hypothetical protein
MNRILFAVIVAVIITIAMTGNLLNQNAALRTNNDELAEKLENTTHELDSLKKNYTDLMNLIGANLNGELTPPIKTRLGIKLIEGQRYLNYLWATGEVENAGNLTLYNVRLRFTLYTNNGSDVKEDIIGTLQSHQLLRDVTQLILHSD